MNRTHQSGTTRPLSRRDLLAVAGGMALGPAAIPVRAQESGVDGQAPAQEKLGVYDDFTDPAWPSPRWSKFRSSQYDLWDPEAKVSIGEEGQGTLAIDLPQFTASHPNHVKALMLSTRAFDLKQASGFIVRADMKVRTFGTEQNPHGLVPGDVRLAAGALVVIDPDTGMVFDFFVSNDRIRPLYERLPVARTQLGDYPAYSILGANRPTEPGAWHRYEIRYLAEADRVEWWVDGKLLASQDGVGAAPGEDSPVVKLRRPRIGGGLFTLLDDLNNDKRRADDRPKVKGYIPSNWEDRFGQGAQVIFRKFDVGISR